jgi:hypothetical protein
MGRIEHERKGKALKEAAGSASDLRFLVGHEVITKVGRVLCIQVERIKGVTEGNSPMFVAENLLQAMPTYIASTCAPLSKLSSSAPAI